LFLFREASQKVGIIPESEMRDWELCWRLREFEKDLRQVEDFGRVSRQDSTAITARDAHRAADLLLALEHSKTMDQALAHIKTSPGLQPPNLGTQIVPSTMGRENPSMEMEL
jgi:hypothetical protein